MLTGMFSVLISCLTHCSNQYYSLRFYNKVIAKDIFLPLMFVVTLSSYAQRKKFRYILHQFLIKTLIVRMFINLNLKFSLQEKVMSMCSQLNIQTFQFILYMFFPKDSVFDLIEDCFVTGITFLLWFFVRNLILKHNNYWGSKYLPTCDL